VENSKIKAETDSVKRLVALVASLRGEHGCPWDQKQTPQTMLIYLMEEMYELADAIESDNYEGVREELGDVLFHIVFLARLFQERGDFSIDDVAQEIADKMIRRHPHVFGNAQVDTTEEVRQNWHKIKQSEKNHFLDGSILDSVPKKLPALMRAYQISERTARSGFDSQNGESILNRLGSELDQLKQAVNLKQSEDDIYDYFGMLLFSLVHLARFLRIHPETALCAAVKEYEKRIRQMENKDFEK
jgi:tetrapyrrole methylase family protein/MazG family protein